MADYEQTQRINGLVRKAFGEKFDGTLWFDDIAGTEPHPACLGAIGSKGRFFIPFLFNHYNLVGRFTKEDGSEMEINPEFRAQAERYAELYQQMTNKPATVNFHQESTAEMAGEAYYD